MTEPDNTIDSEVDRLWWEAANGKHTEYSFRKAVHNLIAQEANEARIDELITLMQSYMDRNSVPPFTTISIETIKNRMAELTEKGKA